MLVQLIEMARWVLKFAWTRTRTSTLSYKLDLLYFLSLPKKCAWHSLTIHTYDSLEFRPCPGPWMTFHGSFFYSNGSRNFWRSEASKWETAVVMLRSGPRVPEGISRNGLPSCRRIKPMHICSLCSLFPPNILFDKIVLYWYCEAVRRYRESYLLLKM